MKIEGKCAYGYYRIYLYVHYIVVACVVKISVSVDHQNIIQINLKSERERSSSRNRADLKISKLYSHFFGLLTDSCLRMDRTHMIFIRKCRN